MIRAIFFAVAVLGVRALAACGGDDNNGSNPDAGAGTMLEDVAQQRDASEAAVINNGSSPDASAGTMLEDVAQQRDASEAAVRDGGPTGEHDDGDLTETGAIGPCTDFRNSTCPLTFSEAVRVDCLSDTPGTSIDHCGALGVYAWGSPTDGGVWLGSGSCVYDMDSGALVGANETTDYDEFCDGSSNKVIGGQQVSGACVQTVSCSADADIETSSQGDIDSAADAASADAAGG
jgi:hypothetical protein